MIKISKDLTTIPASLLTPATVEQRQKSIDAGKWITSSRYKLQDIKDQLKEATHYKCCYCEKSIRDTIWHVEHYRPKTSYYWLAHSWDNLLCCCDWCNIFKNANFEIGGAPATFDSHRLNDIHHLGEEYDLLELPKMVNPEREDVEAKLIFTRTGEISSHNDRVAYTINTCKISRTESNDRRKKLVDDLQKKIDSRILEGKKSEIPSLITDFKSESIDPDSEYLAFRRYVVQNIHRMIHLKEVS